MFPVGFDWSFYLVFLVISIQFLKNDIFFDSQIVINSFRGCLLHWCQCRLIFLQQSLELLKGSLSGGSVLPLALAFFN